MISEDEINSTFSAVCRVSRFTGPFFLDSRMLANIAQTLHLKKLWDSFCNLQETDFAGSVLSCLRQIG